VVHHKKLPTELFFRTIYWGRFVGWAIATPLAFLNLTVLAGLPGAEILLGLFAAEGILAFVTSLKCNYKLIIKGLIFSFAHRKAQWAYFAISGLFFIYVVFTLIISSRRAAITRNAKVGRFYTAISVYTIIVWAIYPLIWLLGVGLQKISVDTEILLYAIVRSPFQR